MYDVFLKENPFSVDPTLAVPLLSAQLSQQQQCATLRSETCKFLAILNYQIKECRLRQSSFGAELREGLQPWAEAGELALSTYRHNSSVKTRIIPRYENVFAFIIY